MGDTRQLPVPDGLDGMRVDAGLSRLLGLSRTAVVTLTEEGRVAVDGHAAGKSDRLVAGSWLEVDLPDAERPTTIAAPAEVVAGLTILHEDDDIVVVDKPHFLATMPRGRHVAQTALVRLRQELNLPELSPAHRLDRLTAGVLLFTARRELRGAYQTLFAQGLVRKTYLARAAVDPDLELPSVLRSRIIKRRGHLQAVEEPGKPNAETLVEHVGGGLYRLIPRTGRTHQLRLHMASIGLPIDNDPLYPNVIDVAPDDFSQPMQLLAHSLEFGDPVRGHVREFVSRRTLENSG